MKYTDTSWIITEGGYLDGYFLCPHASPQYVERKDLTFNDELVCECDCIKPNLGMVRDSLKAEGLSLDDVRIFVVGDRMSDVNTGIHVGGSGVLVPFSNEPGEADRVRDALRDNPHVYIAKDLKAAATWITDQMG